MLIISIRQCSLNISSACDNVIPESIYRIHDLISQYSEATPVQESDSALQLWLVWQTEININNVVTTECDSVEVHGMDL